MIEVAEYTSPTEMRAAYSAIRNRFLPQARPRLYVVPKPVIRAVILRSFDQHVVDYSAMIAGKMREVRTPQSLGIPRSIRNTILETISGSPWTLADIVGHRRTWPLIAIRHECMLKVYRARPDMSLTQIAKSFNRDHTSVLFAIRKLEAMERGMPAHEATVFAKKCKTSAA